MCDELIYEELRWNVVVKRDFGNGFYAVPRDAVTLNGLPLKQLNNGNEPYDGYWHLIAPNGKAIDNSVGRPHLYRSIEEMVIDVENFLKYGGYSTCG